MHQNPTATARASVARRITTGTQVWASFQTALHSLGDAGGGADR